MSEGLPPSLIPEQDAIGGRARVRHHSGAGGRHPLDAGELEEALRILEEEVLPAFERPSLPRSEEPGLCTSSCH